MTLFATLSLVVLFVISLSTLFNLQTKLTLLIEGNSRSIAVKPTSTHYNVADVKSDESSTSNTVSDYTEVLMGSIGNNILSSFGNIRHVGLVIGYNIFRRIGNAARLINTSTDTRSSTDILSYTGKGTKTGIFCFIFSVSLNLESPTSFIWSSFPFRLFCCIY